MDKYGNYGCFEFSPSTYYVKMVRWLNVYERKRRTYSYNSHYMPDFIEQETGFKRPHYYPDPAIPKKPKPWLWLYRRSWFYCNWHNVRVEKWRQEVRRIHKQAASRYLREVMSVRKIWQQERVKDQLSKRRRELPHRITVCYHEAR